MALLGIDVGTQSLKAVVTDERLRVLGAGSVGYQPHFPQAGWAEQDPALWLGALAPAIGAALAAAGLQPDAIAAMAVTGQLDGCIGVDTTGEPVAPAIIWMDRRATGIGAEAALVRERSGLVCDATHMAAKIAWARANWPGAARVSTWHQPVSYVVERLTGARVMDRCLASTTMLYALREGCWDGRLLDAFGIAVAMLPEVAEATASAGPLTAEGAMLTGLPPGVPVAVGTGDDFASLLGGGVTRPGTLAVTIGTSEIVGALAERCVVDAQMLVETHAFHGGLWHLGNPGWLAGGAVRWARELMSIASDEAFSALAGEAPAGADGVTFVPALSGAMAPRWAAEARGTFHGLTAAHGKPHLARAVLEGCAFAMRDVMDRLTALGVGTERIRLVGGGAGSAVWRQIRADLSGRPVEFLTDFDASAMGAAMIASVLAGVFPDALAASASLHLPLGAAEPDATKRATYDEAYGRYRDVFERLNPSDAA